MEIKKMILWFLSRSPIFSVTSDKDFHEIRYKEAENIVIKRFSLISFGLGDKKIYFISITSAGKFNFLKIIRLENIILMNKNYTIDLKKFEEQIDEKVTEYKNHLVGLSKEEINIEIEFLKYKIESEVKREDTVKNKMSHYLSISLAITPLVGYYFNEICIIKNGKFNSISLLLYICFTYLFLNFIKALFDFNNVKKKIQSMFLKLKQSCDKQKELASLYYLDFYYNRNIKNELGVSYVLLCERYFKYTLIFGVILFLFNSFSNKNYLGGEKMKKPYIGIYINKYAITESLKNSNITVDKKIDATGTWFTEAVENSDTDE